MFTEATIAAIKVVSGQIIYDLTSEDAGDPAIVAEMTLDADRLAMFGHPEANREVKALCAQHGWKTVHKEAEKHVYTA